VYGLAPRFAASKTRLDYSQTRFKTNQELPMKMIAITAAAAITLASAPGFAQTTPDSTKQPAQSLSHPDVSKQQTQSLSHPDVSKQQTQSLSHSDASKQAAQSLSHPQVTKQAAQSLSHSDPALDDVTKQH
jgi:hypothetical protein